MKKKKIILRYDPEDSVGVYCQEFGLDGDPRFNPAPVINHALCTGGASIVFHHPEKLYLSHFALDKPALARIASFSESETLLRYMATPKTVRLLTNELYFSERTGIKDVGSLFPLTLATLATVLDRVAGNIKMLGREEQAVFNGLLQTLKDYVANFVYCGVSFDIDTKILNAFVYVNRDRPAFLQ